MGRPRKPTSKHDLEGTRPGYTARDRGAEPQTEPLGYPPASLKNSKQGGRALDCWHEIVASIPPGVALESDRFTVEIAARLLARMRTASGISAAELGSLQRALASLGMTPSDRSKVGVQKPGSPDSDKPVSPWDKLGSMRPGARPS